MVALDIAQPVSTGPTRPLLYVERDPSYVLVRRRMIGTMTRAEWDAPQHRETAIRAAWLKAIDGLRGDGEHFVVEAPVVLYRHPTAGTVVAADVTPMGARRQIISSTGARLADIPPPPLGLRWVVERTSYARWAEGPLPHRSYDMEPAPSRSRDRALQEVRHRNRALRDLIDRALGPAELADVAWTMPSDISALVDFRIRGVFRRRDYRVLVSKQDAERGSKIILSDGIVE